MKKLALVLCISWSMTTLCLTKDRRGPLFAAINELNVEQVQRCLETAPWLDKELADETLVKEMADEAVKEVNAQILKTMDLPSKTCALAQILVSTPLFFVSANFIAETCKQIPNSLSLKDFVRRLLYADPNGITPAPHNRAFHSSLAITAGVLATVSAGTFLHGICNYLSNKNSQHIKALAIKALVWEALDKQNLLKPALLKNFLRKEFSTH